MSVLRILVLTVLAVSSGAQGPSAPTGSTSAEPSTMQSTTTQAVVTTTTPSTDTKVTVSYNVKSGDGVYCLLLNGTIKLVLPYQSTTGVSSKIFYLQPNENTAGSSCAATWDGVRNSVNGQRLTVSSASLSWKFELFFENSSNTYAVTKLRYTYAVSNATFTNVAANTDMTVQFDGSFASPLITQTTNVGGYYMCTSDSTRQLNVTGASWNSSATSNVTFSGLYMQAFRTANTTDFSGSKTECSTDYTDVNYLVPIVVGCALAGVILIVLVAYIIGRYRSRHNYQTV